MSTNSSSSSSDDGVTLKVTPLLYHFSFQQQAYSLSASFCLVFDVTPVQARLLLMLFDQLIALVERLHEFQPCGCCGQLINVKLAHPQTLIRSHGREPNGRVRCSPSRGFSSDETPGSQVVFDPLRRLSVAGIDDGICVWWRDVRIVLPITWENAPLLLARRAEFKERLSACAASPHVIQSTLWKFKIDHYKFLRGAADDDDDYGFDHVQALQRLRRYLIGESELHTHRDEYGRWVAEDLILHLDVATLPMEQVYALNYLLMKYPAVSLL